MAAPSRPARLARAAARAAAGAVAVAATAAAELRRALTAGGATAMHGAGQALLPARCLLCGEAGADLDLCADCAADLPWNRQACRRCGLPLPIADPVCGACLLRPPPFAQCHAVFRYEAPLDRLLPRLKYHGDLAAGALVSALMLQTLGAADRPGALVPVPLHDARLGARGYNQALELARPLARALSCPLLPGLLVRTRATAAQTELDAEARRVNVRGAFALADGSAPPAHVVLVDDTMTTGATVAECARVLRRAGVARVDVWVAARAP